MPNRSIRVLVVYHHLPHYRRDVFAQLEADPALEVEFAAAPRSRDGSIPTIPGSALRHFHPLRNTWIGPFLWQVGLVSLIVRRRPDVVVFLGDCSYLSSWAGAVLARARKASVLFWTIGWHRSDRGLRRIYRLTFYRLASKLLLYGNVGRDIGIAMGYPAERMTVVYNSSSRQIATPEEGSAATANLAARLPPPGRQVVGAVIRLNESKRLDLLIRAAARLRQSGRPVEVLLVGDGPERSNLGELADRLGVPVWLPGAVYTDADLALVYDRCLLSAVPSAAGLTVLQSFRFGRPFVTHGNMDEQGPECEAITPGTTGDLYTFGDFESLCAYVELWLDRQLADPDSTATACRRALTDHWNADVSARLISAEVRAAAGRHELV